MTCIKKILFSYWENGQDKSSHSVFRCFGRANFWRHPKSKLFGNGKTMSCLDSQLVRISLTVHRFHNCCRFAILTSACSTNPTLYSKSCPVMQFFSKSKFLQNYWSNFKFSKRLKFQRSNWAKGSQQIYLSFRGMKKTGFKCFGVANVCKKEKASWEQ